MHINISSTEKRQYSPRGTLDGLTTCTNIIYLRKPKHTISYLQFVHFVSFINFQGNCNLTEPVNHFSAIKIRGGGRSLSSFFEIKF